MGGKSASAGVVSRETFRSGNTGRASERGRERGGHGGGV